MKIKSTLYPFNVFMAFECVDEGSVDLIYCDPPWKNSNTRRTEASAEGLDSISAFHDSLSLNFQKLLSEMWRVLSPNGSAYVHLDPRTVHIFRRVAADTQFVFRNEIILINNKKGGGGGPNFGKFASSHQNILFFTKNSDKKHTFNGNKPDVMQPRTEKSRKRMACKAGARNRDKNGKVIYDANVKFRTDVWDDVEFTSSGDKKKKDQKRSWKPERIFELIYKTSANKGNTVLDVFCGSGERSFVEARKVGLNWIGIDPEARVSTVGLNFTVADERKSKTYRVQTALKSGQPKTDHAFEKWVNDLLSASKPVIDGGIDGYNATDDFFIQSKNTEVTCGHVREFGQSMKNYYFRTYSSKSEALRRVNSKNPICGYIVGKTKAKGVSREIALAAEQNIEITFLTPEDLKSLARTRLKKAS